MPWDFFFILTLQIMIWFIVLGFPLYLLVGALSGAIVRGSVGAAGQILALIAKATKDPKTKDIL